MKVLLADDNITAQRMGSKILIEAGYSVVAVSNGAAAVKKIASEKPELIILDVYMPGYSGLEVCEKVKSAVETMRVPVLLTVTNMEPFNQSDGNRVKADGVLVKPFEATDLLAAVKRFEQKIQSLESFVGRTAKSRVVEEFPEEVMPPATPQKSNLPDEIANAPALGLEELQAVPDTVVQSRGTSAASALSVLENFGSQNPNVIAGDAPIELELNSQSSGVIEVARAAELQPTLHETPAAASIAQDPALAVNPSDFSEFVTKFVQADPEDIPVGIAMQQGPAESVELHDEPSAAAEAQEAEQCSLNGENASDEDAQHGALAHEQAPGYAGDALVMEEATSETDDHSHVDRIFALEPTMHDAAIDSIQSLIGEFRHHSDTGFTLPTPAQQTLEASAVAVAAAPEAEAGTDTQPVDVWPQMHPAELPEPPEVRTYEAHEEAAPAEVGVDTQKIEVFPDTASNDVAFAAAVATETVANLPVEIDSPVTASAGVEPSVSETSEVRLVEPHSVASVVDVSDSLPQVVAIDAADPAPILDEERVAAAVNTVLERYKSELIAAIVRELKN